MSAPVLLDLQTTTSTQEVARRLIGEGAPHGAVVVAVTQTAGRGRRGRGWLSGPHGLWMSLVLRGALPTARAPRLPLVACDVVVDVLRGRGVDVVVKWPNDLLVPAPGLGGPLGPCKKAGGLLLEAVDVGRGDDGAPVLQSAVLGLGLNLTAPEGGFPPDLAATAGALVDAGLVVDGDTRLSLCRALGAALASALPDRAADAAAFAGVRDRLRKRSATLGRRVTVDGTSGVAIDLDPDGALLVRDDVGAVHTVRAGDVLVGGPAQ